MTSVLVSFFFGSLILYFYQKYFCHFELQNQYCTTPIVDREQDPFHLINGCRCPFSHKQQGYNTDNIYLHMDMKQTKSSGPWTKQFSGSVFGVAQDVSWHSLGAECKSQTCLSVVAPTYLFPIFWPHKCEQLQCSPKMPFLLCGSP